MHPSRLGQSEYTRLFSEAVAAHEPPSISTDVIDVIAGEKFTARIEVADGRAGTRTVNGALPAGVTQEDGYPTGTIMNPSRISLSVTFTDRSGLSDTATVTLSVAAAIPVGDSLVYPSAHHTSAEPSARRDAGVNVRTARVAQQATVRHRVGHDVTKVLGESLWRMFHEVTGTRAPAP